MRSWIFGCLLVIAGCGSSGGSSGTGGSVGGGTGGAMAGTGGAGGGTGGSVGTGGGPGGTGGAVSTGGMGLDAGPDSGSAGTGGATGTGGAGTGGTGGTGGSAGTGGGAGTGGMGGGNGARCGGLLGLKCPQGQWCDYPADTCGAADQQGECKPAETMDLNCGAPVCGCNGKSYANACRAHRLGMDTAGRTCIAGNGGVGASCAADGDCQTGLKCCESGGSANSNLICKQIPAGTACPLVP